MTTTTTTDDATFLDGMTPEALQQEIAALPLEATEQLTVQLQGLMGALSQLCAGAIAPGIDPGASLASMPVPDIDCFMAELGMDAVNPMTIDDETFVNDLLAEHDDETLLSLLNEHIDSAINVATVLANRPVGRRQIDLIRRIDRRLLEVTIHIEDLRQRLLYPDFQQRSTWQHCKTVLLREFHFINNAIR